MRDRCRTMPYPLECTGTSAHNLISNAGSSKPTTLLLPLPLPLAPPSAYHSRCDASFFSNTSPTRLHSRVPEERLRCIACTTLKDLIRPKASFGRRRKLIVKLCKRLPLGGLGFARCFASKSYDTRFAHRICCDRSPCPPWQREDKGYWTATASTRALVLCVSL
jgi:hypothetical protein